MAEYVNWEGKSFVFYDIFNTKTSLIYECYFICLVDKHSYSVFFALDGPITIFDVNTPYVDRYYIIQTQ